MVPETTESLRICWPECVSWPPASTADTNASQAIAAYLPVQKLTRPDLDRLLTDLRDGSSMTAKGHPRRAWSPRSLNKAVDAWRAVLAYGIERRELGRNVAAALKKVPRVHQEMSTYTPDEIRPVLRAADKDRNGHLWYLALSGLRRGEIAGLRWSDVDLGAGTISVMRNRVQAGAGYVVEGDPKTLSSRRTLPLDDGLVSVLRRASARYAEERLALGAAHADGGYVAVNEAGEPYTPDSFTRMWHKLAEAAGVRPIRLHDARHSCGTALHLRGVQLAVIAKWLGHADASITARIYVHSQDDALRAAGATLGQVVTPGAGSSGGLVTLGPLWGLAAPVMVAKTLVRWCPRQDSNLRPSAPEADALSPELRGRTDMDRAPLGPDRLTHRGDRWATAMDSGRDHFRP